MSDENKKRVMPASEFFAQQGNGANDTVINKTNNTNQPQQGFLMSGKGKQYPVPDIISKHFNWGAFLLSWIWGLGNNTYITLLIFATVLVSWIPIVGWLISLGVCIWFGIKGNEWAWQNKYFPSIEAFHEYQKKWATAGLIFYIICMVLVPIIILSMTLPALMSNTNAKYQDTMAKKSVVTLKQVIVMNEALEEKCELTSNGLAACFEKRILGDRNDNVIEAYDGVTWVFDGNGKCKNNGDCKVSAEMDGNNILSIPLYINTKGYIYAKEEDLNSYIK